MKKITLMFLLSFMLLFSLGSVAQSTATYDINFTSTWNSLDHGILPVNAHWSNLVGANHNSNVTFLEMGSTATTGIENVAEVGSNIVFNSEVQAAIDANDAGNWLNQSFSPSAAISSATLNDVLVSEDYSLLTLVSMIAPSPDWIIAVNSLNLWDESMNKWKESFTLDLFPYDAGTEEGFGYSSSNSDTNPRGVITNISNVAGYPFNSAKIGILTITFKSTTLDINDFENTNNIKIFPNPSSIGNVTVTNVNSLNKIEIYDVLGKRVKQISIKTRSDNNQNIDISDLNKGLYIVKLLKSTSEYERKKIIVR